MAGYHFRADEIPGIGKNIQTGDVIIVAHRDDGDVLELAFPSEEIPQLGQLLADAFAELSVGSGPGERQTSLLIDAVEILGQPPKLILSATLSTGLPVAYSLPEALARQLRDKLNAALGDG